MGSIKANESLRMARAIARAEAAAKRCEELAQLLEVQYLQDRMEDGLATVQSDRLDANEAAITELAEILGGE